jgi:hypothetical protein
MSSFVWDVLLFGWGFLGGFAVALGCVFVARMRREAAHGGEQLIAKLTPLERRRFLQVVTE